MGIFQIYKNWRKNKEEDAFQLCSRRTIEKFFGSEDDMKSASKQLIDLTGVSLNEDEMLQFLSYAAIFLNGGKVFHDVKQDFDKMFWKKKITDGQLELLYDYVAAKYLSKDELRAISLLPKITFANAAESHLTLHVLASNKSLTEYTNKLPIAIKAAGWYIQEGLKNTFGDKVLEQPVFSWIQSILISPSFQHLCFRYKNTVFSVLIALGKSRDIYVSKQDLQNQLRECEKYDLLPCIIALDEDDFHPLINGSHLRISNHDIPVNVKFHSSDYPKVMSEWEIYDLGIQVVRDDISKSGCKIDSYCNIPGIDPQIWFLNKRGEHCYVIVSVNVKGTNSNKRISAKAYQHYAQYNGFFADVEITGEQSGKPSILYRGKAMFINYEGLIKIEKTSIIDSNNNSDLYTIRE